MGETLQRGQVNVRVMLKAEGLARAQIPQLQELKTQWESAAKALGYDPKETVTLSFLVEQLPYVSLQEDEAKEEQMKELLKEGISVALKELSEMKEREGETLAKDISERLKTIEEKIDQIDERSGLAVDKYRDKLLERLKECQLAGVEADDRVLREAVIYAEKLDVSEEKTRLRSHLDQFKHLLNTSESSIGKTLDFLTQELNREANTIASKSSDGALSMLSVAIKSEIEKIREQVQNIE